MFQRLPLFLLIILSLLSLAACAGTPAAPPQAAPAVDATKATAAPSNSASVELYYEESAQFELVSPQGTRVLIDIAAPSKLTAPPTAADILLTTHSHSDHLNANFVKSFPGQQLNQKEGALEVADVKIKGVKSAHTGDTPDGSDYIFVIEMGGLRIGHFGDCGQSQLTQAQLDQVGQLDVLITQLKNSYSAVSLENKKAFNLIDQLKPKLVIPAHGSEDDKVIKYALGKWKNTYVGTGKITISPARLSDATQFLVLTDSIMAAAYKKLDHLPEW